MAGTRKIPGAPTLCTRCLDIVRRTPGLPAYIIAQRMSESANSVNTALQKLVKAGTILSHMSTNTDDAYFHRVVYFLPENTQ